MNAATLGTWRNPPLAYVVAELIISPYYSMSNAVPGLQDRLRQDYPRTVEAQEIVIDGNKPAAQPLWRLISADQKHAVQLGTRTISLHATDYMDSTDFLGRWAVVLQAIGEANLGAFVERAGLRYIDLVVPSTSHVPADYLDDRLQGLTPEGSISTGSMWISVFQFEGAVVNLKTAAPSPQGMVLPPDFNALPLEKPKVMQDAEVSLKAERPIGFIDTDCVHDIQRSFDAAELATFFTKMQKLTSRTFKAAASSFAKGEWM